VRTHDAAGTINVAIAPGGPSLVWRTPVLAWVTSRLVVILASIIGAEAVGPPQVVYTEQVPRPLSLLGGWDSFWYMRIALDGYQHSTKSVATHHTDFAFFPLLPAIMRIGTYLPPGPLIWGVVASNLMFLVGLVAFHALTEDHGGRRLATRATWVVAFSPAAVYASLAYTDGMLFGLAALAALLALRDKWVPAALVSAAAVLTRPQGVFVTLLVVMIVLAATTLPLRTRAIRAGAMAVIGVAPLVAFLAWLQVSRGSWSLPFVAQRAWFRRTPGRSAIREFAKEIHDVAVYPFNGHDHTARNYIQWTGPVRDLVFTAMMVGLVWALARHERSWTSVWVLFSAIAVAMPFVSGTFTSEARFGLLAFPLTWPIAVWLDRGGRLRIPAATALACVVMVALVFQLHYTYP
jgi:hypothetical protein